MRSDTHAPARLAHAAFEDRGYVELLRDGGEVQLRSLEAERRRARGHAHAVNLRQDVQQLFGETVREVLLILVRAEIGERQDRDRGRVFIDRREQRLQRRKRLRQSGMAHLVNGFTSRQALQMMLAEQLERHLWRGQVAAEIVRDLGEKRLSPVSERREAGRPVHRRAVVVAVAQLRRSGVQRHADANRHRFRPGLGVQRPLRRDRRLDGIRRAGERGMKPVTRRLDDVAAMLLDASPQQRVVARQRDVHRFALQFPQRRAADDIGEQKRHRSDRQGQRRGSRNSRGHNPRRSQ